jgi:hypothetical protein
VLCFGQEEVKTNNAEMVLFTYQPSFQAQHFYKVVVVFDLLSPLLSSTTEPLFKIKPSCEA